MQVLKTWQWVDMCYLQVNRSKRLCFSVEQVDLDWKLGACCFVANPTKSLNHPDYGDNAHLESEILLPNPVCTFTTYDAF